MSTDPRDDLLRDATGEIDRLRAENASYGRVLAWLLAWLREAVYAALDGRTILDIGDTSDRAMIDRLRADVDEWRSNAREKAAEALRLQTDLAAAREREGRLLRALRKCVGAIEDELRAAGPDDVRGHPTLKEHSRIARGARALLAEEGKP